MSIIDKQSKRHSHEKGTLNEHKNKINIIEKYTFTQLEKKTLSKLEKKETDFFDRGKSTSYL